MFDQNLYSIGTDWMVCLSTTGLPFTLLWRAEIKKLCSFFYSAGSRWIKKTRWEGLKHLHLKFWVTKVCAIFWSISVWCLIVWCGAHSSGRLVWQFGDNEIIGPGGGWAEGWKRGTRQGRICSDLEQEACTALVFIKSNSINKCLLLMHFLVVFHYLCVISFFP